MRRRPSPLIVVVCALFLLGTQQAAYAHWISHIGAAIHTGSARDSGDSSDHGDALSHAGTSCAAFAALAAAPPAFVAQIPLARITASPFPNISPVYLPARSRSPYTACAPPAVL